MAEQTGHENTLHKKHDGWFNWPYPLPIWGLIVGVILAIGIQIVFPTWNPALISLHFIGSIVGCAAVGTAVYFASSGD